MSSDTTNLDKVRNIVVYGNPDTSAGNPVLNGLNKAMVNVAVQTIEADMNGVPISQKITVSVSGYQFRFVIPIIPDINIPPFETSLYTESMGYTG